MVSNSAPARSFPGLVVVLYSAAIGQFVGNTLFSGQVSAFVGALVMTPVAYWVSLLPSAMPPRASFLPGFWLLVPGALGLIGLTQVAGDAGGAGAQDLVNTVVSIFAIALGVLCGTLLLRWGATTGRAIGDLPELVDGRSWLQRLRARPGHGATPVQGGRDGDLRGGHL